MTGTSRTFSDDPQGGEPFSAAFLVQLTRGNTSMYRSPTRRSATIELHAPSGGVHRIVCFSDKCYGIFNNREEATLQVGQRVLRFSRERSVGLWRLENSDIAETTLGFGQHRVYWGASTTRILDGTGTVFVIKMPFFGPGSPQLSDCVCYAQISPGIRVRMFLGRPSKKPRFLFDSQQAEILSGLSHATRVALLGEWLRIKTLST